MKCLLTIFIPLKFYRKTKMSLRTLYQIQNSNADDDDAFTTKIEFFECCAPFERGCDSLEEFQSKRITTFDACLIPAQFAQQTMQHFDKSSSSFSLPQHFT